MPLELGPGLFATKSGQAPNGPWLRWPKDAKDKVKPVAFLVGGELKTLPALEDLVAARLVFPAVGAHSRARTRVGAAPLKAPAGQPYDFSKIGDVLGTEVVPIQVANATDWNPPKLIKLDVTLAIRAVITGDAKFHGFALRVVPDHDIDNGWSVTVKLPKQPRIYLELDVHTDAKAP